jgi:hypothetical protein
MIKLYKEWVESKRLANLATRVDIVNKLDKLSYMGKRFILTEYLLTQEQLARNDQLWGEENGQDELSEALDKLKEEFDAMQIKDNVAKVKQSKKGLRGVGVTV